MKKTIGIVAVGLGLLILTGCEKPGITQEQASKDTTSSTTVADIKTSVTTATQKQEETVSSEPPVTTTSTEDQGQPVDYQRSLAIFRESYPEAAITDFQWQAKGEYAGQAVATYQIEGEDSRGEYKVYVNAEAEDYYTVNEAEEDNDDWQEDQLPVNELIKMEEAILEAQTKIVSDAEVTEAELEEEDGQFVWEIKFFRQRQWQKVVLDAKTGDVLKLVGSSEELLR